MATFVRRRIPFILLLLASFTAILRYRSGVRANTDILESLPPTLEIVILVHPSNKANVLPYTLGGLEQQDYPKDRINLYLRTEILPSTGTSASEKDANKRTLELLETWIRHNGKKYHNVEMHDVAEELQEKGEVNDYWTRARFSKIITIKERAFAAAQKNWADYIVFMDADVVLTNPQTFTGLVIESEHNAVVFAPMLYSLGTYSNFWAGITDKGYYLRTDEYIPILERQALGTFEVPMIHSCIFIDLRIKLTHSLRFSPDESGPYDDIISFALSAKNLSIPLHVNNEEIWGFLPPPIDDPAKQNMDQELVDLELESLVEGPPFPVAKSLKLFIQNAEKQEIGVDNIYVINLERRPERLNRMRLSLEKLGLKVQVWPATDGKELTEEKINKLGITIIPGYLDPYHQRPVTYGEIGCFLSHYYIWRDIINQNYSSAVILEDDVRFERNVKARFESALQEINLDEIDFIYLGRKAQAERKSEKRISPSFVRPDYSYWTIGYLVTNRGVRKLLDAQPLHNLLPVDEFLPLMFDKQPHKAWTNFYPTRNLVALSFDPVLISPTHYIGDEQYISDTEASTKASATSHPKHTEL